MAKKTKTRSKGARSKSATSRRVVRMKPAEPGRSRRNTKAVSFGSQAVRSIRAQTRGGDDVTIVGVGASAGGLEAFSSMVRALPSKPGFALVQHLAPQHESALPTLLTSYTTMPVLQVTDGMRVEPNHLYVTPPNVQM